MDDDARSGSSPSDRPDAGAAPDLDGYRHQARAWLAEHCQRRDGPREIHEIDYYTPEVMATNRARQRVLFDGGYAGITWPKSTAAGPPSRVRDRIPGRSRRLPPARLRSAHRYHLPRLRSDDDRLWSAGVPPRIRPKVLAGEALVCQFFSEPSSGSDLAVRALGRRRTATNG